MTKASRSSLPLLAFACLALPGAAWASCANTWTSSNTSGTQKYFLEAESGSISGNFSANSHGGASNGKTVESGGSDNNTVYSGCTGTNQGCDSFTFVAPSTGDYKMQAQVQASSSAHQSFLVEIASKTDCGGAGNVLWKINTTGSSYLPYWVTDDSGTNYTDTATNARVWLLTGGTSYTITFRSRQAGTRLDWVKMYIDPDDDVPAATATLTRTYTPVPGTGNGLCGNYYNTISLNGAAALSITAVDYNWGSGQPVGVSITSADNYSSRYQGQIQFPYPGSYTLTLGGDDGVRMWLGCVSATCAPYIGNPTTADSWVDQGYLEYSGAAINVTGGAKYDIRVEYYEHTGSSQVSLQWSNGVEIPSNAVVAQKYLYVSGGLCAQATATPAATATLTPTPVIVWQGLPPAERLYGLEYIPFPVTTTASNTFNDLSYPVLTAANNNVGKNTARYKVVITGFPSTPLQVETRIGPYGVTCTSGYFNINDYSSATTLSLPSRPQNLSTTYAWIGDDVPITERYDTVGDPRYVPYSDMLNGGQADFANNYNWYFKNLGDTGLADYEAEYTAYLPRAVNDRYNGGPNIDVPKLMMLWRQGIARTASIYTSMTGFSNYYIGEGGEIGGDSANKLPNSVVAWDAPWSSATSGVGTSVGGHNEITGSTSLVRMTGTASATGGWISRPWIGELWPDVAYASDWASPQGATWTTNTTWGNLRNPASSGGFYRASWDSADITGQQTFSDVHHITADPGCATFMNGNGGTSGDFGHSYNDGYVADWLYDAQVTAQDYNFAIPNTFSVARPWGLNRSNTPPESGLAPYSTNRFALSMYTASTQTATNTGFYAWGGVADQRSSSAIRGIWTAQSKAGWFIVNGLAPSTDSGINFVARFAILSCLRTFHEAGAPSPTDGVYLGGKVSVSSKNTVGSGASAKSYRIDPIPYVKITDPTVNQDLSGYQSVTVQWNKRFVRWDGQRYTENYPCIDDYSGPCTPQVPTAKGNPDLEWHALTGTALVYNLKYSMDAGSTWKSCLTDSPASAGDYLSGLDSIPGNASNSYSYTWDISQLPAGTKKLRLECYRSANTSLHYGYHEIDVKTKP